MAKSTTNTFKYAIQTQSSVAVFECASKADVDIVVMMYVNSDSKKPVKMLFPAILDRTLTHALNSNPLIGSDSYILAIPDYPIASDKDFFSTLKKVVPQMLNKVSFPKLFEKVDTIAVVPMSTYMNVSAGTLDNSIYEKEFPLGKFIPIESSVCPSQAAENLWRNGLTDYYKLPSTSVGAVSRDWTACTVSEADDIAFKSGVYNPMYLDFKLLPQEEAVIDSVLYGKCHFVICQGEPGTGKTTLAYVIAARLFKQFGVSIPFATVDGSVNDSTDLIGTVGAEVITDDDGNVRNIAAWHDGALTKVARNGGICVCNEANYIDQRTLSVFHSLVDGSATFRIAATGEVVPIHPNSVFIFTYNPGVKGAYPFNPALFQRADFTLNYPSLTTEQIAERLGKYFPKAPKKFLKMLADCPKKLAAYAKTLLSKGSCGFRQLQKFCQFLFERQSVSETAFISLFENTVLNNVLQCNVFSPDKVEELLKGDDLSVYLKDLYTASGCGELSFVDYSFYADGTPVAAQELGLEPEVDELSGLINDIVDGAFGD